MAVLAIYTLLLCLAMARYSSGAYCVCNRAMSDSVLQKNIDYACGSGADCNQISQNGPCFNPNTVIDHCNYAVNSYYQRKGEVQGSCDFSGTATVSQTPPSGANSVCFSANPSTTTPAPPGTGTGTPGTGTGNGTPPPGTGTGIGTPPPGTGTGTGTPPPGTGTGTGTPPPGTGTGTGTPPPGIGTGTGTGTPGTGTGTGTGNGINLNPPIGMGPTGINGFDNSDSMTLHRINKLFNVASLLVTGLIWFRFI